MSDKKKTILLYAAWGLVVTLVGSVILIINIIKATVMQLQNTSADPTFLYVFILVGLLFLMLGMFLFIKSIVLESLEESKNPNF